LRPQFIATASTALHNLEQPPSTTSRSTEGSRWQSLHSAESSTMEANSATRNSLLNQIKVKNLSME
jgi:hypothetical protein